MSEKSNCAGCGKMYKDVKSHYYDNPTHRPEDWDECHSCGERYDSLGNHWGMSDCKRPSISEHQHEIITGVLMGDGSMVYNRDNPSLHVDMITKEYLEYLDTQFGDISLGVSFRRGADEIAKNARDRGFDPNAKKENYSDMYALRLNAHPELQEYADWYSSGEKVFPDSIELTPTVLKHWYCCDGTKDDYNKPRLKIIASNERKNKQKIANYFSERNLPEPKFNEALAGSPKHPNHILMDVRFTVEDSKEIWEYMGEPLPGFEYKWPDRKS